MPNRPARYAVFGHPIAHSLSPRLHALFAAQVGIVIDYAAMDVAPDAFAADARAFFAEGGAGANVTLPHKAAAFALADVATPVARRLGVANVLTRLPDGRLEADSNDGAGLVADLARLGVELRGRDVLLLGAGGAARAGAFALLDAGVPRLVIANRTAARAQALADDLGQSTRVRVLAWEALGEVATCGTIVNATSAGVRHADLRLPATLVNAQTLAYDLSYGAAASGFVEWARARGCAIASDGLGMLVETAAASFERWHGVRPDVDAPLRSLRERS